MSRPPKQKCLYKQLQVEPTASNDQIKAAFDKLAPVLHPSRSRNPSAEANYSALENAFNVLSDETLREQYDLSSALRLPAAPADFIGRKVLKRIVTAPGPNRAWCDLARPWDQPSCIKDSSWPSIPAHASNAAVHHRGVLRHLLWEFEDRNRAACRCTTSCCGTHGCSCC